MEIKNRSRSIYLKSLARFLFFAALVTLLFYLPYHTVKTQSVKFLIHHESLIARLSATGIEDFFKRNIHSLFALSVDPDIIMLNKKGRKIMTEYLNVNHNEIFAITRVNAKGRIVYTVPEKPGIIGKDVSYQLHNRFIMKYHKPIVSSVFKAVQGYDTVAVSVPIFKNKKYHGSLTILIPFSRIAWHYLNNVKLNGSGNTGLISRSGRFLYGSAFSSSVTNFHAILSGQPGFSKMLQNISNSKPGFLVFQKSTTIKGRHLKHIEVMSYYPVSLPENKWTIIVSAPESLATKDIRAFGSIMFVLFLVFLISLLIYFYVFAKRRMVEQEKKQRLKSERQLLESQRFFKRFLDTAPIPIAIVTKGRVISYLNNAFIKLFGYPPEEIPDVRHWLEHCFPEKHERDRVRQTWIRALKAFRNHGTSPGKSEFHILCRDGSYKDVEFAFTLTPNEVIASLYDTTEKNRLEREKHEIIKKQTQNKKMESLGMIAGSVAHDLNNILSGITGYPELLLMQLPDNSPLRKSISAIKKAGERAADVVADLLTIARGVKIKKSNLDFNFIIEDYRHSPEFEKLQQRHPQIRFVFEPASRPLPCACSKIHVIKTLMNLVTNAAEAIRKSGTVSIRSEFLPELEKGPENSNGQTNGPYILLSVQDDGAGIPQKDIAHIFEPFYSTKSMGKSGTGLGLAVVQNTVEDHGGFIRVDSHAKGTRFELYFPASSEDLAQTVDPVSTENIQGHGELIFIADDEKQPREIAAQMLEILEYRVKTFDSGEALLKHLRKNNADLILLDMIMYPGMSGFDCYKEVLKFKPEQKVIIVSGLSRDDFIKQAFEMGLKNFLKKPYTLNELGLMVKKALL